jgi:hypothetical protein
MEKKLPLDMVSQAILIIANTIGKTWRFKLTGESGINPFNYRDKGVIYCFWHSNILPLSYLFRGIGVKAVVSSSSDGERAAAVAQRWNHETIRGSSTLHGVAVLRQCVRELRKKQNVVLVPDGPHGPKEIVKPGVAQIALMANAPVYPVSAIPKKSWRLNSWDKFIIPKPFTTIELRIGAPIIPSLYANNKDPVADLAQELQRALLK